MLIVVCMMKSFYSRKIEGVIVSSILLLLFRPCVKYEVRHFRESEIVLSVCLRDRVIVQRIPT